MARNKQTAARKTKTTRPGKTQTQTTVEVVEVEGGGMGLDDGIILTTGLLLAGALVLGWVALSGSYPG